MPIPVAGGEKVDQPGSEARRLFVASPLAANLNQLLHQVTDDVTARMEFESVQRLFECHPTGAVRSAIDHALDVRNPRLAVIRQNLLKILDDDAPRFNYCTGGTTSLEINAMGDYTRCSRFAQRSIFIGNVLHDEKIRTLDVVNNDQDASCDLNCKRRMCFRSNVIRAATRTQFDNLIQLQGLRGDYRKSREDRRSNIFIRWKMTDTCNYTCSYCSAWKTVNKKRPELDGDSLIQIAKKFTNQFDKISLRITGGEPSTKKNFVPLMRFLNDRLDRFVEIEVRTNFSFPQKQQDVFAQNWQNKLHYHIGCHVFDKNFRPWDFAPILTGQTSVSYKTKFVSTPSNQHYVDAIKKYFIANGIPVDHIKIIQDFRDSAEDASTVPPAIKFMAEHNLLHSDFYNHVLTRTEILAAKTATSNSRLVQINKAA